MRYRKPSKYTVQFFIFIGFFVTVYLTNMIAFGISKNQVFHVALYATFSILGAISFGLFIKVCTSDPGILCNFHNSNNIKNNQKCKNSSSYNIA